MTDVSQQSGLILANLDVEQDLAASLPREQRPRGGPATLPRRVLEAVAAFGTLMRAVARPGDRLWLPTSVAPQRLAEVPGLPKPELVDAPWPGKLGSEIPPPLVDRVLPWGECRRVLGVRSLTEAEDPATPSPPSGETPSLRLIERPPTESDLEEIWSASPPSPQVVARVSHRAFSWQLAHGLGWDLPKSRMVATFDDLRHHLHDWPKTRRWVLKDPLSAAGRGRLWGNGPDMEDALRQAVTQRLERWPQLLFEPWVNRIEDFGVSAWLRDDSVVWWGMHRQLVDVRGGFRGIELLPSGVQPSSWTPEVASAWRSTLLEVSHALAAAGYRGPFGIDGYRYRRADGNVVWQTLGEINPRWTFGSIAHWLAARLAGFRGWNEPVRLRLAVRGKHRMSLSRNAGPPRSPWRPWVGSLLLPTTTHRAEAWLEAGER